MGERTARALSRRELGHILGRLAMAVGIGWTYLAIAYLSDFGGWGSWMDESRFGPVVKAELLLVFAVAFGCTGAHVGRDNVMLARVRARR